MVREFSPGNYQIRAKGCLYKNESSPGRQAIFLHKEILRKFLILRRKVK